MRWDDVERQLYSVLHALPNYHRPADLVPTDDDLELKKKFWRAWLVSYGQDRWGVKGALRVTTPPGGFNGSKAEWRTFFALVKAVGAFIKAMRAKLSQRRGRIQAQVPTIGMSCLSIVRGLDTVAIGLLMLALSDKYGVEGHRASNFNAVPFVFPSNLQDRQPVVNGSDASRSAPAPKLNAFMNELLVAMRCGAARAEFREFVTQHELELPDGAGLGRMGIGPDRARTLLAGPLFDIDIFVPAAEPSGDQEGKMQYNVILWTGPHASAAALSKQPNGTLFLDRAPASLLTDEERHTVEEMYKVGEPDFGSGSGRGGARAFQVAALQAHATMRGEGKREEIDYGYGYQDSAGCSSEERVLSAEQVACLEQQSYLVVPIDHARVSCPTSDSHVRATDEALGLLFPETLKRKRKRGGEGVEEKEFSVCNSADFDAITNRKKAKVAFEDDGFTFYNHGVDQSNPLSPFAKGAQSHQPQAGGGPPFAASSGLGPSLGNHPEHRALECSGFVSQLFRELYGGEETVIVAERGRIKPGKTPWSKIHIDRKAWLVVPEKMREHLSTKNGC